jgi:membrane protein DedA with SNARE-associated domain
MFFSFSEVINLLLTYRYIIIFPIVMIEGPITTLSIGFLSYLGYFHFWLTYLLIVLADLTSDALYYLIGRLSRNKFFYSWARYLGFLLSRIEKFELAFQKYGGKILIFGKIADPLSSTIQMAAGFFKMNILFYFLYNVAATLIKSLILLLTGFYFGESINQVNILRKIIGISISFLGIICLIIYLFYRRKIKNEIESYVR